MLLFAMNGSTTAKSGEGEGGKSFFEHISTRYLLAALDVCTQRVDPV